MISLFFCQSRPRLPRGAVRRDPGYADAWAFLAYSYLDEYRYGYGPGRSDALVLDLVLNTGRRAVDLDGQGVYSLLALSLAHFYRREFAEAEAIHDRLLSLNPTNPEVLAQIGWRTAFAGNWDQGIAFVRRAIDRSIKAPNWYYMFIAFDDYRRGDYQAALAEAERIADPEFVGIQLLLAAIHGQLGNQEEARRALDRMNALNPSVLRDPRALLKIANTPEEFIDQVVDGLVKAGLHPAPAVN
jgi:tetratricopeptide (TPR) repeat protein